MAARGHAVLAWVAVAGFLTAAVWPAVASSPLPLLGLRNLTTPLVGWPLTAVTAAMAIFLSIPAWLSRERLLMCAGFSFCLFLVVAFYASPVAAIIFLFIGVNIVRDVRV